MRCGSPRDETGVQWEQNWGVGRSAWGWAERPGDCGRYAFTMDELIDGGTASARIWTVRWTDPQLRPGVIIPIRSTAIRPVHHVHSQ